jgi:LuxR family maltose regulon positive regulatory protein
VDKWYLLDEWLKKLPDEVIHKSIPLLLAQMWILHHKNKIWVIPDFLKKIDKLRETEKISKETETEIQFFKAILLFWNVQIKKSYKLLKYVKDNLPEKKIGAKGINAIYYAVAAKMNGKIKEVVIEHEKLLSHNGMFVIYKHLLLAGIIYVKLLEGDLFVASEYVVITEKSALRFNDVFVLSWMNYFMGLINYQQNNLKKAEYYFEKALEKIYVLNMQAPIDCFAGMLLTLQANGKKKEFNKIYNQMIEFVNERNNPIFKTYSFSLRARLALLSGDLQSAENFIGVADMFFDSGNTLFEIELPRLTNIKLLLAQNTPSKINEAIKNLDEIKKLFDETINYSQLIPTLVLQAIAYKKKGNTEKAMDVLITALTNGERGKWISPFIEAGEEIRNLLLDIKLKNIFTDYITQILENFPSTKKIRTLHTKLDILTNRELDVISLLAKRYSNKEIADTLFISPATVKRHTITIYHKLGVNKRQQAVQKAQNMGIL